MAKITLDIYLLSVFSNNLLHYHFRINNLKRCHKARNWHYCLTQDKEKSLLKVSEQDSTKHRRCFIFIVLKCDIALVVMRHWFFITTNTNITEIIFCHFGLFPEIHQDYLGVGGNLYPPHSFLLFLRQKPAIVHGQESFRLCGKLLGENFCLQAAWMIEDNQTLSCLPQSGGFWTSLPQKHIWTQERKIKCGLL